MAACLRCGKHGVFLKLDAFGFCTDCQIEAEHEQRLSDLKDAIANAQAQYESQILQGQREIEETRKCLLQVAQDCESWKKRLDKIRLDAEETMRIRSIADCVLDSYEKFNSGMFDSDPDFPTSHVWAQMNSFFPKEEEYPEDERILIARIKTVYSQIESLCIEYEEKTASESDLAIFNLMILGLESELSNILRKAKPGKRKAVIEGIHGFTWQYCKVVCQSDLANSAHLRRFISQIDSLYTQIAESEYERLKLSVKRRDEYYGPEYDLEYSPLDHASISRKFKRFAPDLKASQLNPDNLRSEQECGKEYSPGEDPMFPQALRIVAECGYATVSNIQRCTRAGYARSGRMVDAMFEMGIISAADGANPRDIIVPVSYINSLADQIEYRNSCMDSF